MRISKPRGNNQSAELRFCGAKRSDRQKQMKALSGPMQLKNRRGLMDLSLWASPKHAFMCYGVHDSIQLWIWWLISWTCHCFICQYA